MKDHVVVLHGLRSPAASWPFGSYSLGHEDLAQHLHKVGKRHAQRALRLYSSEDSFEMLDAAFSAGSAVELLAKAVLADIHPALLLGAQTDLQSLLKFTGASVPGREQPDAFTIRSLDAEKCLERLRQLDALPPAWAKDDSKVFHVRNASAHLGMVDRDLLQQAIRSMVRFAEHVRSRGKENVSTWWGSDFEGLIGEMLKQDTEAWESAVHAKLAAARQRFAELKKRVGPRVAETVFKAMSGKSRTWIDHDEPMDCPVCGYRGRAVGVVLERGTDVARDGDYVVYYSTMLVVVFECSVCDLELTDEREVELAGLETQVEYVDEDYARTLWQD